MSIQVKPIEWQKRQHAYGISGWIGNHLIASYGYSLRREADVPENERWDLYLHNFRGSFHSAHASEEKCRSEAERWLADLVNDLLIPSPLTTEVTP